MNSILAMNLLLDTLTDTEELLVLGFIILSCVLALFFVYLLFYYIFRGIEILLEPMFKERKLKLEISPALGAFLSALLIFVIVLILILTEVIPLSGIIDTILYIFN